MRTQYRSIVVFFLYAIVYQASAQKSIVPLSLGDAAPDITFNKIINSETASVKLSSYRGKVVVLYFWSLSCAPCIRALPKYDELQKKIGNQFQFIPITFEKKDKVSRLLEKHWHGQYKLSLPFVVEDTLARKYFPYVIQPHSVWMDKNGKIIAIGDRLFITEANINKAIKGEALDIPVKADPSQFNVDLFANQDPAMDSALLFHSYLGKGLKAVLGIDGFGQKNKDSKRFQLKMLKRPLVNLYTFAMNMDGISRNLILFEGIKDMTPYLVYPEYDNPLLSKKWMEDNLYSYQLEFNDSLHKDPASIKKLKQMAHNIMLQDLNKYFGNKWGLTVRKENRILTCNVLIRTNTDKLYRSTASKKELNYVGDFEMYNKIKMSELIKIINIKQDIPIVDGTYYDEEIDIKIPTAALKDINKLKETLNAYGLDLKADTREFEVLVFKEATPN